MRIRIRIMPCGKKGGYKRLKKKTRKGKRRGSASKGKK